MITEAQKEEKVNDFIIGKPRHHGNDAVYLQTEIQPCVHSL